MGLSGVLFGCTLWFSFDCVYQALPHTQMHFSCFVNHTQCPALFWALGFVDVGLEPCVNSRLECLRNLRKSSGTTNNISKTNIIACLPICLFPHYEEIAT